MARFEEENERTLGVVQTLISLIEENTLARGNTNLVTNYVFALAQKMHYPAEHLRDLMYGTVLRDIGMIKVSDLIVRSPRELHARGMGDHSKRTRARARRCCAT